MGVYFKSNSAAVCGVCLSLQLQQAGILPEGKEQ